MIDTVIFKVTRFNVSPEAKMGKATEKFGTGFWSGNIPVLPPSNREASEYFPALSIVRSSNDAKEGNENGHLQVQVSAPKLLFGTNLAEMTNGDIDTFICALVERLKMMGVSTGTEDIGKGRLMRVDFSKNIQIEPGLGPATVVISDIGRIDYRPRSNFEKQVYNPGKSIRFCNSSRSFSMYAKMCEIYESGYTAIEKQLAAGFKNGRINDDILRVEESLRGRLAIQRAYKRYYGAYPDHQPVLTTVWDCDFSRFTLLRSFEEIYTTVFADIGYWYEHATEATLAKIHEQFSSPALRGHAIDLTRMIARIGIKAAITQFKRQHSGSTLSRVKKSLALIRHERPASSACVALETLHAQLQAFIPITIENIKKKATL